jgi:hypothetical protein
VVEDGPAWERGVELLVAKYRQYQDQRPAGPVIVIAVEHRRSWSAS